MSRRQDVKGFTMIEMVVVLAVIAILAAILTPIINSYVDRARLNTARNDVKNIAAAVVQFNTDARFWPIYKTGGVVPNQGGADTFDWIATEGLNVTFSGANWPAPGTSTSNSMNEILNTNYYLAPTSGGPGRPAYRGPYLEVGPDPFGSRYYLTSKFLKPGADQNFAAYVISAGPDQEIDTKFDISRVDQTLFAAVDDDIIARIR